MRQYVILVALAVSAVTLSAQHGGGSVAGGGRGGFAGASHGSTPAQSFNHAAPRFATTPHSSFPQNSDRNISGQRSLGSPQYGGANTGNWTSAGFFPSHSGQVLSRDGRGGRHGYGYGGYGYPLVGYPFGYYGGIGFDDGNDPNTQGDLPVGDASAGYSPDPQDGPEESYLAPVDRQGYPYPPSAARPAYDAGGGATGVSGESGQGSGSGAGAGSDGLQHPKVTLVFKDGHKLQVQNYAITQTRILVTDNNTERDYPLKALDISATAATNDAAGVEFHLPGSP